MSCSTTAGPGILCRAGVWFFLLALGALPLRGEASADENLHMVVQDEVSEEQFLCLPVEKGQEFEIEFLHSYDRFPFKEFYRILEPGRIQTIRMVFRSMLNGEGFTYPGARVRKDGWGEIDGIQEVRDRVEFLMGSPDFANHRLRADGKTYVLAERILPGTRVLIEVRAGACPQKIGIKPRRSPES